MKYDIGSLTSALGYKILDPVGTKYIYALIKIPPCWVLSFSTAWSWNTGHAWLEGVQGLYP